MTTPYEFARDQVRKYIGDLIDLAGGPEEVFGPIRRYETPWACTNPGGHVFATSCGETRCRFCPKIAWR